MPHVILGLLASLSSVSLALAGLLQGRPGWIKQSFALGMILFGLQALASSMLLAGPGGQGLQLFWLLTHEAAAMAAPFVWIVFVSAIMRDHGAPLPRAWKIGLSTVGALGLAVFAALVALGGTWGSDVGEPFGRALLTSAGLGAVVFQLVLTTGVLAGLEVLLRTVRGVARRRIKYLALGLGGVFLVRFYVLSQVALFQAITSTDLNIETATLLVGNLVIGVSLTRNRMPDAGLTVSRSLVYRSVIVGVLGAYLLAVGGLGWLLSYLEIPEKVFWVTLGVFVATLALAAVLLSEEARWRLKRFIALNFYRSKYDYREQWGAFTRRLSTHVSLSEVSLELVEAVSEAVGSDAAVLYVADDSNGTYHLTGSRRLRAPAPAVEAGDTLVRSLAARDGPLVLETDLAWGGGGLAAIFPAGSVLIPLGWRGDLTGFLVVGPERTGVPYTAEDIEFMATMGQQATGSIVTARLSEDLARARAFDAFARVASFVIHDLKNLISSLSLLSQNAIKYFDDPEFQKDTILTLSRTVERMQSLLTRLSSRAEPVVLRGQYVDLPSVASDAIATVTFPDHVKLVTDLRPVPQVPGDSEALLRMLQNLLTNAIQAMQSEGTVTVVVKHDDGKAILSVTDTGRGMSEQFIRESLFVPFRTTKPGGWGIGLYQVKEIVERHGGKLAVASKEGAGTTFQITLPTESSSRQHSTSVSS
jgi:putative PEP-CTERM system histidine kinase